MSSKINSDVDRPETLAEHINDRVHVGGDPAVFKWKHKPDASSFDDSKALSIIRAAILEQHGDPQQLRNTAAQLANLLPVGQSIDALSSLWRLFISLAQQTPASNVALLNLVVILDQLSGSPRTTTTVNIDGFEQYSRLHGLNQMIKDHMISPYISAEATETLTRWINLNAFASLLWSYNLIDGRDYAIQQLRSAFEDRNSSDVNDKDAADARLMAAAQWAIHSCHRLYYLSIKAEATSPGRNGANVRSDDKRWKPGPRFKGQAGFSFRRWEFWQQAFEEAQEFGNGGIEAKIEAGAASGMMEKVLYAGFEV